MKISSEEKSTPAITYPRLMIAPNTDCIILALNEKDGVILVQADGPHPLAVGTLVKDFKGLWEDYHGTVTLENDG